MLKNRWAPVTVTVNDLVDAHEHTRDEQQWVRAKMADLEDRSRRNNVKICGIPETILPADLNSYARKLISTLLPDLSPMETIIDRIHRLPKPPHLPAAVPRDTRPFLFNAKDMLLATTRRLDDFHHRLRNCSCLPTSPNTPANRGVNFKPLPNH